MKILYVLSKDMYFGPRFATLIDLSCRDLIGASAFRGSTRILAPSIEEWFPDFDIHAFPATASCSTRARVAYAARMVRTLKPDIIVVQRHLPTAAGIARKLPDVPVILHRHNFLKAIDTGTWTGRLRRAFKLRLYGVLAGVIHVSEACDQQFATAWPEVKIPRAVVPNGFPVAHWRPASERATEILCVGRSAPEKGILEAAQAITLLLPTQPEWRARFILSNVDAHPAYHRQVLTMLATVVDRVTIEVQLPYSEVVAANERAAISIIPSKSQEPFGRTALDAHAGGAAVISSGLGGLREISGDCAVFIDPVEPRTLLEASRRLIADAELRETLARKGREHVAAYFSNGSVSARADAFFAHVCQSLAQKALAA